MDEYLTIAEAAALLKVSPKRLRNLMCTGVLKLGEHLLSAARAWRTAQTIGVDGLD